METKIDYLDRCVNIINGCTGGCQYCWARKRMAPRLAHRCKSCGQFKPHWHPERLDQINHKGMVRDHFNRNKWVQPIIGLNFMGDTWGDGVDPAWRVKIWEKIQENKSACQNKFVVLTKQPQNIKNCGWGWSGVNEMSALNNLYVGVSIDEPYMLERWIALTQKEYIAHKIISFEPVLSLFMDAQLDYVFKKYGYPEWVIIGALTGAPAGPKKLSREYAVSLKELIRSVAPHVPVFVKDNVGLINAPKEFPKGMRS